MTAMIGIGLMATPMANGSESPIDCPITPAESWVHDRSARRGKAPTISGFRVASISVCTIPFQSAGTAFLA